MQDTCENAVDLSEWFLSAIVNDEVCLGRIYKVSEDMIRCI